MKKNRLVLFLIIFLFPGLGWSLCVKVKKANLRSGPSTKKQITWEVFQYMPLRKISARGSWVQVKDFEGDTHWIHKKLVTSSYKCAVVKVDKANLRTGPGTKFGKATDFPNAEKYMVFKLAQIKGSWAKIVDSFGDSYWVYRSLIWIY